MKLEKFGDLILRATQPQMVLANLYDDWLKSISSYTAFSRLILLLRALHVNNEKSKIILRPNKSTVTQPHHVWPTLEDEEWIRVELALRDLILQDYGTRNSVNVASLTSSETRDIILGMEIQAPSAQRQQMAEIEKAAEQAQVTAVQTQTTNIHGDTIQVVTTSNYEQQTFASKTDWRIRAISATNLPLRLQHVYVTNDDVKDELPTFVLAKNILRSMVNAADLRSPVGVFLFGIEPEESNAKVVEIKAIAVPPQRASQRLIEFPEELPKHPLLEGLKLVGIAFTESQESQSLSPSNAIMFAKLMAQHDELTGDAICLTVAFTPGSLSLACYCLTPKGFEFCRQADPQSPNGKLSL